VALAGQFFHIHALSSMVGMKVDFAMRLTLMASSLYTVPHHGPPHRSRVQPLPGQDRFPQPVGPVRVKLKSRRPRSWRPWTNAPTIHIWSPLANRSAYIDALVRRQEVDHPICPESQSIGYFRATSCRPDVIEFHNTPVIWRLAPKCLAAGYWGRRRPAGFNKLAARLWQGILDDHG
jgi:hypothetical protein